MQILLNEQRLKHLDDNMWKLYDDCIACSTYIRIDILKDFKDNLLTEEVYLPCSMAFNT